MSLDNSLLSAPLVNIFKMEQNLIKDYLIYADVSNLQEEQRGQMKKGSTIDG